MAAKPKITTNYGYSRGINQIKQVKIATSNLFIDTKDTPIDYMTGAVFDGIGGNEFINSGGADIILQQGKSLVSNSSEILESISSKTNEKQADGIDATYSQFETSLNSSLPLTTTRTTYVGITDWADPLGSGGSTFENANFPELNTYFDSTYENICIDFASIQDDEEVEIEFIVDSNVSRGII